MNSADLKMSASSPKRKGPTPLSMGAEPEPPQGNREQTQAQERVPGAGWGGDARCAAYPLCTLTEDFVLVVTAVMLL